MVKNPDLIPTILYEEDNYALADIPLSHIQIPKERFRASQDDRSKAALDATLQDLPLLNEVGVLATGNVWQLIYGESRIKALQTKGEKMVRCKIWHVTADQALYMQLAENAARGTYSKAQLLDYVTKLTQSKKLKKTHVAKLLGVDPSDVTKLTTIADMSEKLKTVFVERNVPVDVMYELRLLSNDPAKENALTTILMQNQSKDTARHFIRHELAALCDQCGKTANQRQNQEPLVYVDGSWLCSTCRPPPPKQTRKEAQEAAAEQPPTSQQSPGESTSTIQQHLCLVCGKPYQETLVPNPFCPKHWNDLLESARNG